MSIEPVHTSRDTTREASGGPRVVETNVFHAFDEQEEYRIDCHCFRFGDSSKSPISVAMDNEPASGTKCCITQ